MSIKVNCLNPIAACGLDMLNDNYEELTMNNQNNEFNNNYNNYYNTLQEQYKQTQ